MVKRNALGQSVVCSEKTKARGKVKSIALAVATASAMLASVDAVAGVYASGDGTTSTIEGVTLVGDASGSLAIVSKGEASASGNGAIAIGSGSQALSQGSVALFGGFANSRNSIAIGSAASTMGINALALNGVGDGDNSVSIKGYTAGNGSIAIGGGAYGDGSIAIGGNTEMNASQAVSINGSARAANSLAAVGGATEGASSIAIGSLSSAVGGNSVAIGTNSKSLATNSLGMMGAIAESQNSIAVGYEAVSSLSGSVALGSYAKANTASAIQGYLADGKTNPTWQSTLAAMSIGDASSNYTRQIIGVAAGTQDTDAVNVAQLKASTNEIVDILGGNATVATDGNVTMTNIGGTGKDNINDAIAAAMTKAGGNTTVVEQGDGITVTKATSGTTDTYTVALSDATKQSITKAQTDATKGIADAAAAQTTADAAKATADKVASTTYKFAVANGQTAASTANGDADTWNTTESDSLTLGATTDLSVTTDGAGKVIYGLSDATKQTIANKADKSYVDAELAKKADKADVDAKNAAQDAEIAKKADKADLDALSAVVDTKADKSYVDATNAAQDFEIQVNRDSILVLKDTKADQSALDATNDKLTALDNAAVKYDDPVVKDKVTLGGTDGTTITNVKPATLSATSTDAVNGSQLYTLSEKMKNLTGADVVAGNGTTVTKTTKDNVNTYTVSVSDETLASITKAQTDATQALADAKAADDKATAAQNTANDALVKADNAQTTADKAAADVKALDEIAVKYDSTAKDTVTLGGASGTTITNVKAGNIAAGSTDAVNGSQLFDLYQYVDGGNTALRQHINMVEDKLQAGIAGSNASASLPQVRGNGKSMMAFGLGGFQDKGALAVGFSRSSDNGRTVFKAHLNADTEKQIGGGIGLGFEW